MDNINRAKGNGTVNRMTVWRWFSKFRNNQMDIADKKRSGRPREVDRVAVVNAIEVHPSMTTRIMIEEMRESLTEFFDSKDREWYRRGIHKLEEQWQKVIESGGEYFDY
uniref:Mos1 transposase HTH domain-containing protein n=1 Tax=Acrobeloides nanus TaxID=290746 RepID=A0A914CIN8_9BILA